MVLDPAAILLDGRRALVTGAAAGIGRATTLALARFGAAVAVCDRDAGGLETLAAEVELSHVDAIDVRDGDAVAGWVGGAVSAMGGLDIVVNNAGGGFAAAFVGLSDRAQTALVDENFTSVTNVVRVAVPHLGPGSAIVNVTSVEAHRAAPGFAVYAAMKAAVANLTKSLALELGERGIRVTCVAPDDIPTPGVGSLDGVRTPLGGPGKADDVAAAVVFLVSDMAAFVTGTTLHVDGGTHAAGGWRLEEGSWTL